MYDFEKKVLKKNNLRKKDWIIQKSVVLLNPVTPKTLLFPLQNSLKVWIAVEKNINLNSINNDKQLLDYTKSAGYAKHIA